MLKLHKSEGFSLVELMIVVAIMAILAAIAIPTYLNFQMKARESEARTNLAAIKTCEESYKAEEDVYLDCAISPSATPPAADVQAWVDTGTGFTNIGFNPNGSVRYVYEVTLPAAGAAIHFTATADGDVDGDAIPASFTVTDLTNVAKDAASAGEF